MSGENENSTGAVTITKNVILRKDGTVSNAHANNIALGALGIGYVLGTSLTAHQVKKKGIATDEDFVGVGPVKILAKGE